jgi:hypothetical protein
LHREQVPSSPYLFTTERGSPMTAAGFRKLLARIRQAAEFPFPVHPHMLGTPAASSSPTTGTTPRHPGVARPQQHSARDTVHRELTTEV